MKPEIYSPEVENFSEGENIFDMSQEGNQIIKINSKIIEAYQKKPKAYKPINKVPKPGGLMEKLREMKSKRLVKGCHYARSKDEAHNQRKIEIIEHCDFRHRLLLSFKFIDDFGTPDPDKPETHNYIVVLPDFSKLVQDHNIYDVIFDLPELEFIANHFVHFGKLIRAGRRV